jgi:hypothetical protein
MEVKCQYETIANCHPSDIWEIFNRIEEWRRLTGVFGDAGWVHGEPWKQGSRFFMELNFPRRMDLEAVVLKVNAPHEVVILSHGSGLASEQWIRFEPNRHDQTMITADQALVGADLADESAIQNTMRNFFASCFDGLKAAAEKHCTLVAL